MKSKAYYLKLFNKLCDLHGKLLACEDKEKIPVLVDQIYEIYEKIKWHPQYFNWLEIRAIKDILDDADRRLDEFYGNDCELF